MLDKKIAELLNDQFNYEFYSGYLYLSFANYYTQKGLNGFANWYLVQEQEERAHALLFMQYLQNNGMDVEFRDIQKVSADFKDYKQPLEAGYNHELYVTKRIHDLYSAAYDVKDFRTMQFLDYFVKEQGEEEKNVEELIRKFELFGLDSKGLYLMDNEMAARVYTAPTLTL